MDGLLTVTKMRTATLLLFAGNDGARVRVPPDVRNNVRSSVGRAREKQRILRLLFGALVSIGKTPPLQGEDIGS